MNIFRKGIRRIIHIMGEKKIFSPLQTVKWLHFIELGRFPNLKNPKDINEKLIWMEFNTDTSEWSRLADKYEVRKYIVEKGLSDILIPLYGVFDSFDEIDFNDLPDSFVIKSTNASAQTIIVRNKSELDVDNTKQIVESWLKTPFGLATGEPHYVKIKPRIIIEKLLPSYTNELPLDYKFYCFNGKVDSCLIFSEREIEKGSYKINLINPYTWEEIENAILPSYIGNHKKDGSPNETDRMIRMAETISEGFPFVRVDLYNINGDIFFGEMTFTPAACRTPYLTKDQINKFGERLILDVDNS